VFDTVIVPKLEKAAVETELKMPVLLPEFDTLRLNELLRVPP